METWVPKTYNDAMKQPNLWPKGRNVVGSKWVYAVKWGKNGEIERRKARMVAKGFTQIIGEDFDETYASVAHLKSVRLVCAIAATRKLRLWQVDFVSAFLNSDNSFEVYMEQPKGFEQGGGGMAMFGDSVKPFIVLCKELTIGQKTLIKLLRVTDTTNNVLTLRSDQGYTMTSLP